MKNSQADYLPQAAKPVFVRLIAGLNPLRFLLLMSMVTSCISLWGQAPDRISYQAVVRDGNNDLIANTQIGVRVTILQGSPVGANVYRERHAPTTNAAGLITLQIGAGSVQNGSLAAINWEAGPYFVEQAIDLAGGTNYSLTSTTELLSVPYALYARRVDRATQVAIADTATAVSDAGLLGLSVGTVLLFGGNDATVPPGWLLCDGAAHDVTTYPALFNLIGTTYGSAPGQFRVPDLRGRGPMGRDASQTEFAALGQTGGSKTHTLSLNELPPHDHGGAQPAGNHRHFVGTRGFLVDAVLAGKVFAPGGNGSSDAPFQFTFSAGDHTHPIALQGGSAAHNNLQPYLTMNFIIKAN
jgi:microcystin-dependent protein